MYKHVLGLMIIFSIAAFYSCNKSNSNAASSEKKNAAEKTEVTEKRALTATEMDSINRAKGQAGIQSKFSGAKSSTPATEQTPSTTTATDGTGENQSFDPNALNGAKPEITFNQTTIDFGSVSKGDVVNQQFGFVNTGGAPLKIRRVQSSCGCVTPQYPFREVQPGEGSYIGVSFNSKDKSGNQDFSLTVHSNARNKQQKLTFKGSVN